MAVGGVVVKCECLKCDYRWVSKVEQPARCPRCKSASWMFPKGVGFGAVQDETVEPVEEQQRLTEAVRSPLEIPGVTLGVPRCEFTDVDAAGDLYRCGRAKGHKGQHAPGERVET